MYLKISVDCPICAAEVDWIYDSDNEKLHRGAMGCPGGCTAIQEIRVTELSESRMKEYIKREDYPTNNFNFDWPRLPTHCSVKDSIMIAEISVEQFCAAAYFFHHIGTGFSEREYEINLTDVPFQNLGKFLPYNPLAIYVQWRDLDGLFVPSFFHRSSVMSTRCLELAY